MVPFTAHAPAPADASGRAGASERTGVSERAADSPASVAQTPWLTIVWNDPVNLMSYVAFVFRSYFGMSRPEAERRMLQVHTEGRAVVARGDRETMERHVQAMHGYGLWATVARDDA